MAWRVGIDTGGTFTDLVGLNPASGELTVLKVHSTPDDPGEAVASGLQQLCNQIGITPEQIETVVHGSTVATNAVLEHKGAAMAPPSIRSNLKSCAIGSAASPRPSRFEAPNDSFPSHGVTHKHTRKFNPKINHAPQRQSHLPLRWFYRNRPRLRPRLRRRGGQTRALRPQR